MHCNVLNDIIRTNEDKRETVQASLLTPIGPGRAPGTWYGVIVTSLSHTHKKKTRFGKGRHYKYCVSYQSSGWQMRPEGSAHSDHAIQMSQTFDSTP